MIPVNKHKKFLNKFLVFDLETRLINNEMKPYLICFFDGTCSYSFYLSDYKNEAEMFKAFFDSLLVKKYNGYKIYAHNFGKFDGVFLLKALTNYASPVTEYGSTFFKFDLKPLMRKDNTIISINLKIKKINDSYLPIAERQLPLTFNFRDSYLLLPLSAAANINIDSSVVNLIRGSRPRSDVSSSTSYSAPIKGYPTDNPFSGVAE